MWEISYSNFMMMLQVIPVYNPEEKEKEEGKGKDKTISFGDNIQSLANYINHHA